MVRPFYCLPQGGQPQDREANYRPLLVEAAPEELKRQETEVTAAMKAMIDAAKPGCLLSGLRGLLCVVMGITLSAAFSMLISGGVGTALEVLSVAAVCWLVVWLINKNTKKKLDALTNDPQFKELGQRAIWLRERLKQELDIPADSKLTDVLYFTYGLSNGLPVPVESHLGMPAFGNACLWPFLEDGKLILSFRHEKVGFDVNALTDFWTVNTPISLSEWNKDIPWNDPSLAPYGIKYHPGDEDTEEAYEIGGYCVLCFSINYDRWEVYIPNYERPVFERLLGRKARD